MISNCWSLALVLGFAVSGIYACSNGDPVGRDQPPANRIPSSALTVTGPATVTGDTELPKATDLTSPMAYTPEDYGANGNDGVSDSDALQAFIEASGPDATLTFTPGATYILDKPLFPEENQKWICDGVIFKRVDEISSIVTGSIVSGSTKQVTVEDGSKFSIGQSVAFYQTASPLGWSANHSTNSYLRISVINGNEITLFDRVYLEDGGVIGSGLATMVVAGPLIDTHHARLGGPQADRTGFELIGAEIDGNRQNNGPFASWYTHIDVYAWDTANGPVDSRSHFERLYVHDSASEGIGISDRATVTRCIFEDIGGNAMHMGQCFGGCEISDNHFQNCNLLGLDGPGHEDACIAFSNGNGEVRITNNYIENGLAGIWSINREDNSYVVASGNIIVNPRSYCFGITGDLVGDRERGVLFSDNICRNTGGRLDYIAETAPFSVNSRLTGVDSGATGTIIFVQDNGTTGEIYLADVVGTFASSTPEEIADDAGGRATSKPETSQHALVYPQVVVGDGSFDVEEGPEWNKISDNYFENIHGYLYHVKNIDLSDNYWTVTDGSGDNDRTLLDISDCKNITVSDTFVGGEVGARVGFPLGGTMNGGSCSPMPGYETVGNVWFDGANFFDNYRIGLVADKNTKCQLNGSGVRNSQFGSELGKAGWSYCAVACRPGFDVINNVISGPTVSSGLIRAYAGGGWDASFQGPTITENDVTATTGTKTIRLDSGAYNCLVVNNVANEDQVNFNEADETHNNVVESNWQVGK